MKRFLYIGVGLHSNIWYESQKKQVSFFKHIKLLIFAKQTVSSVRYRNWKQEVTVLIWSYVFNYDIEFLGFSQERKVLGWRIFFQFRALSDFNF